MLPYPGRQKTFARKLRREQTDAERKLWSRLRDRQVCNAKFRRQHPIGSFVADFCCVEAGLIIELDGGQHADNADADEQRTSYLRQNGFRVLRFWNNAVLQNTDAVMDGIARALEGPHPNPLSEGEGIGSGALRKKC